MSIMQSESRKTGARPPLPPWYKWALVGMLWFICFFNYADRLAISSVLKLIGAEFKFDKGQLGLITAMFMWVYAVTSPFAGAVGDRFRRKSVILGGLYAWSFITSATAWCRNLTQFVAVRGLEGLGEAFYFPASMSLVSDYHGPRTRSRAMGIHQTSVYAGSILGPALAAWLAGPWGEEKTFEWRIPFYAFGILGIILGLFLVRFVHEARRGQADGDPTKQSNPSPKPPQSLGRQIREMLAFMGEVFRIPTGLILLAVFSGANYVATVFMAWGPMYVEEKFNTSLAVGALAATTPLYMANMLGAVLGGIVADSLARRLRGGRMVVQAAGLLVGGPFIYLAGIAGTLPLCIVGLSGFGLCKGIYDSNIWASLYDVIRPEKRASATGIGNMIGWIGGGLGPIIIGNMAERIGLGRAIALSSRVYLVVGLLMVAGVVLFARRDIISPIVKQEAALPAVKK
jgi:MFS family permease